MKSVGAELFVIVLKNVQDSKNDICLYVLCYYCSGCVINVPINPHCARMLSWRGVDKDFLFPCLAPQELLDVINSAANSKHGSVLQRNIWNEEQTISVTHSYLSLTTIYSKSAHFLHKKVVVDFILIVFL